MGNSKAGQLPATGRAEVGKNWVSDLGMVVDKMNNMSLDPTGSAHMKNYAFPPKTFVAVVAGNAMILEAREKYVTILTSTELI